MICLCFTLSSSNEFGKGMDCPKTLNYFVHKYPSVEMDKSKLRICSKKGEKLGQNMGCDSYDSTPTRKHRMCHWLRHQLVK
jgi:hypothetical protein